jgi:BRCT domain type II-containing protein
MQTINEARERVASSLLHKVNVFDGLLETAEREDNQDNLKRYYLQQTKLLNRLEKVVTT